MSSRRQSFNNIFSFFGKFNLIIFFRLVVFWIEHQQTNDIDVNKKKESMRPQC